MPDESKIRGVRPPTAGPEIMVHRVKGTEWTYFTILSESAWGTWVHWYQSRSHECLRDTHEECPNCKRNWPGKWKAYVHCLMHEGTKVSQVFLELTPVAWSAVERQTEGRKTLRGTAMKICKTKGGAKGRYMIEVLERVVQEPSMMVEIDPAKTLRQLWWKNTSTSKTES